MRDDTKGDEASSGGFEFSSNISEILQQRFHRTAAARWSKNLRFLTFAGDESYRDPSLPEGSYSTKELRQGQCTRCELRVPPPAGHICATHAQLQRHDIKTYEKRAKEYNDPCIHVEDASCKECMHIPLFPTRGKATRFRIRRLKPKGTKQSELAICTHFVAVSYCWPSSSAQKSNEPNTDGEQYQVLEEDMKTVRPIRAPRDTVDRAVNFAAQNGFRLIWIDQECIEQDNEKEKELGIQAMDYVYVNAQTSIGLFQATLEQHHLDALLLFFELNVGWRMRRRGPRPLKRCRKLGTEILAEALSIVAMDKWNTRAWILQEAFVSARNMILLFPRGKGITVKGWSLICHDLSLTEIGIKLDLLQECMNQSDRLFTPKPGRSIPIKLPKWAETLERLTWFQPEQGGSYGFDFWINNSKPRYTCNAAVAWSFLKHRDNDRVADRLAILANLCDYSLRLNTRELEKSQSRLSVCVLALTIANGDFSLLSPESYHIPRGLHITQNRGDQDFTWVPSDVKQLQYIRMRTADPRGPTLGRVSPATFQVTIDGLSILGFMWKIDLFVELPSIKDKYRESWSRLWRSNTRLEEQSLEETEKPYIFYETTRAHSLAITQILFEVIELLREENRISIADAIWHSVTNADWRKGECLESITEFPEHLTVEKRKGMFRLEQSPDGSFQHKWLVDRIMLQGGFWVGRLVRLSTDYDYSDGMSTVYGENDTMSGDDQLDCAPQDQQLEDKFRSPVHEHAKLNIETPGAASAFGAEDVARKSGQRSPFASLDKPLVPATPLSRNKRIKSSDSLRRSDNDYQQSIGKTHSQIQLTLSTLMKLADHVAMTEEDSQEKVDDPTDPAMAFILPETSVEAIAALNNVDGRNSQASLRQQRAIFDIEGDTSGQVLVLTPFQKRLEMIPRPETRGMSVSWVVQPISRFSESEGNGESMFFKETLKTTGMVRGMWKLMVQPVNAYKLV